MRATGGMHKHSPSKHPSQKVHADADDTLIYVPVKAFKPIGQTTAHDSELNQEDQDQWLFLVPLFNVAAENSGRNLPKIPDSACRYKPMRKPF